MYPTRVSVLGALVVLLVASILPAQKVNGKDKKSEKPAVKGTFQFGSKTYKLQHGLAHKNKSEDEVSTVVYLTENAFPAAALKSLKESLGKSGNDEDFFVFDPFFYIKVTVYSESEPSINVMLPNGGGFNVVEDKSKVKVSGDRVQGHISLPEPQEVFDKKYRLDAKFDVRLLSVGG